MTQRTDIRYIQYYTDGSAARKIAPVAPLKTIKLPKVKKQKRITVHLDPVAVLSIGMAIVMTVLIAVGMVQLNNARNEMQTMSTYVDTLRQENAQLQQSFSDGYDLGQIEQTALALGLVQAPCESTCFVCGISSSFLGSFAHKLGFLAFIKEG